MSRRTSKIPRRRRAPAGPRLRYAAPLPRAPRALRLLDVAYAKRHTDWPAGARFPLSPAAEPFTPADLPPAITAGLLARAEARLGRLQAADRLLSRDRFWLRAELRLALLGGLHPNMVRRWRRELGWRIRAATDALDAMKAIEAVILEHEPGADRWLRAQLVALDVAADDAGGRP
jgi:hypothetical protein